MTGLVAVLAATKDIPTPDVDWSAIAPNLILMLGGILLLTVVSVLRGRLPGWFHAVWTISAATAAICAVVPLWQRVQDTGPESVMGGALVLDGFSLVVTATICVSVILGALLLEAYLRRERLGGAEWYVLMLLSASGGVTMAAANDLIVVFIGLEILSVAVYVLAAMHRRRISSQEAGLKYFVLGAFSSAFLLYGIALTYGATGSTNLSRIQSFLASTVITQNALLLGGLAFMLVGFGFKVAAVPFHNWKPDVYQGSPTPVTAFMATAVTAAAFAALLRVYVTTFGPTYRTEWQPLVAALTVLTLVVGAFLAISQTNVKRMLAYSSINHAGFVLLGVLAASAAGDAATLFYLVAYTFMAAGSFAVVAVVGRRGDGHHDLSDYEGLSRSRPGLALVFTILLLSQAGVPLTAGFLAKFYVLAAAVESGYTWLAVLAMLTAVVSAFMYLRIVVTMYFTEPEVEPRRVRIPAATGLAMALCVVGVLVIGIVPGPLSDVANDAMSQLVATGR
ncbi:MAG: NADH-quinone oxidoreductase subunit N [Microthrixaceae bacterium]